MHAIPTAYVQKGKKLGKAKKRRRGRDTATSISEETRIEADGIVR